MKKGFILFLMVLGLAAFSSSAFAASGYYVDPSAFYMHTTDSNGGTNVVSKFSLDQQPWLHLHMPEAGLKVDTASWYAASGFSYLNPISATSGNDVWLTISNWNSLSSAQKLGIWSVDSTYSLLTNMQDNNGGKLNFNVLAPEPISALLFILGGAGLGIRRFFVKK